MLSFVKFYFLQDNYRMIIGGRCLMWYLARILTGIPYLKVEVYGFYYTRKILLCVWNEFFLFHPIHSTELNSCKFT